MAVHSINRATRIRFRIESPDSEMDLAKGFELTVTSNRLRDTPILQALRPVLLP